MKKHTILFLLLLAVQAVFAQLPTETFEGTWTPGSGPTGWTINNVAGPAQTWQQATNPAVQPPYQGTKAAYLNRETVAPGTLAEDWLITPLFTVPTNAQLRFYSRLTQNVDQGSIYKVYIGTNAADLTTFTELQSWTELEINPVQQEYIEKVVNIPSSYSGQQHYIAFVMRGNNGDRWLIDNVSVFQQCLAPTTLTATSINTTSATLGWVNPAGSTSWEVEVTPATQAPTRSGEVVSTNFYTSETLQPSTSYVFYVRSLCSPDGNKSDWAGPYPFSTTQISANLNFSTDFEAANHGFTLVNGNQTNQWFYGTTTSSSPLRSLYITNDNGINNLYTNTNASIVHAYRDIVVPEGTGDINLSFDWKGLGQSGLDNVWTWAVPVTYTPIPGTQISSGEGNIQIGGNLAGSNSWKTYNQIFNASTFAGGTMRIVFEWRNDSESGTNPAGAIDNVSVKVITCPQPVNVAITNVVDDTATLSWEEPGTASSWEVHVIPATQPEPTTSSSGTIVTTNPYTITGLTSGTVYNVYLRSVCAEDDRSLWSIAIPPPVNDFCDNAIVLQSHLPGENFSENNGSLFNATASADTGSCAGTDDDIWYEFIATNTTHYIAITGISGNADIDHALYSGNECTSMSQLYCSNETYSTANNLVIGETYRIRVFTNGTTNINSQFSVNTIAFSPSCLDMNPGAQMVKQKFIALINHLISASSQVYSTMPAPYNCSELTALAPYITDPNPAIYNFIIEESTSGNNGSYMKFNFTNHPIEDGYDVSIFTAPDAPFYSDINIEPYTSPNVASNLFPVEADAAEYFATQNFINKRMITVRHIDFCADIPPPPPCDTQVIVGNIGLSEGLSCIEVDNPIGFVFVTENTNITAYTWVIYNFDLDVEFTSHDTSPSFEFDIEDSYFMELTVRTTDGCEQKIYKNISVVSSCEGVCTEHDPQSLTVKNLYLALINKLLDLYPDNPVVSGSAGYNCPELVALQPYLSDSNALIYNINYNVANSTLSFAFGNHPGADVTVKDIGSHIVDIDLFNFVSYDTSVSAFPVYANGAYIGGHSVKHVKFCPTENPACPPLEGTIKMDSGLSCITQNVVQGFYFDTDASGDFIYNWTFFDSNGTTELFTSPSSHPSYKYEVAGNYNIHLEVTYGNGCTATFNENVTVSSIPCPSFCTETNDATAHVKDLYKSVVNYVLMAYYTNGSIPNGTAITPLTELASYIDDSDPKLYNVIFDHQNNVVKFSFGNHGSSNDVIINLPGVLYAFVSDINLMNFDPENTGLQSYVTVFTNNAPNGTQQVRHINFCPGVECVHLNGEIIFKDSTTLEQGLSIVPKEQQQIFSLVANVTAGTQYLWTFYYPNGSVITTTDLESPTMTFHDENTYKIVVTITEDTGCKSTYTKTVTVLDIEPPSNPEPPSTLPCTESNDLTGSIRYMFISLLNHILGLDDLPADPEGYICDELNLLAPYIDVVNPRIYDAHYNGQTLSFSFSDNQAQPDVVIKDYGIVTDVNLYNYTTEDAYTIIPIGYSDGTSQAGSVKKIIFCPQPPPCYSHIAFVVDESGSISTDEANRIKAQLSAFLHQQAPADAPATNTSISFIGMSDSDNDLRTDHVYNTINGPGDLAPFLLWLNNYKSGYTTASRAVGISPNSDYWASGLKRAMRTDLYPTPDLVIVITDGSQTTSLSGLKDIVAQVNQYSHLYVYGIGTGSYVDLDPLTENTNEEDEDTDEPLSEVSGHLMLSLKYLLQLPQTEFPVSDQVELLTGDYFEYPNFNHLATDLRYFSDKIAHAQLGCGGEVVPKDFCNDCETFQPSPGKEYWLSAWVMVEQNIQVKEYTTGFIRLVFEDAGGHGWGVETLETSGNIIDGWQRIAEKFTIPPQASIMKVELINSSPNLPVYFDDIRVHPLNGSMKSYVYDPETFKLMAELDDNNYSTLYEYDKEGSLIRVKKETSEGVKTIQESRSGNVIQPTHQD